ncbi:hypothetical protein QBC43DRAFT_333687 [Cladorrhinum sp. PSN259]|nr:hypothetical protein QBC43DRAFT_333687 [Cladorrhinum sp. PSN259]
MGLPKSSRPSQRDVREGTQAHCSGKAVTDLDRGQPDFDAVWVESEMDDWGWSLTRCCLMWAGIGGLTQYLTGSGTEGFGRQGDVPTEIQQETRHGLSSLGQGMCGHVDGGEEVMFTFGYRSRFPRPRRHSAAGITWQLGAARTVCVIQERDLARPGRARIFKRRQVVDSDSDSDMRRTPGEASATCTSSPVLTKGSPVPHGSGGGGLHLLLEWLNSPSKPPPRSAALPMHVHGTVRNYKAKAQVQGSDRKRLLQRRWRVFTCGAL